MASSSQAFFINRPAAKETQVAWKEPPPPNNPVVKGLPLHYGAIAISNLNFVQNILWSNAGFGSLRDRKELERFEPRYDPTVIKTAGPSSTPIPPTQLLKALLEEDWTSKKPSSKSFPSTLDYYEAYNSGTVTPTDVAKVLLPLIQRDVKKACEHAVAFLQVREDLVLKAAEESTRRWREGKPLSVLDGVPVAVKDEVDLTGYKKCYGSNIDFTRSDDVTSHCVKMWQDAGAVVMGKTVMHELGCDITGNNPTKGTPLNPNNENLYCGGSSSGSAYSVAAGLMPLTEGNDGGGSIRIPANYCGLYGLKTTHGRVSEAPTTGLARSTGVAGPIAANMIDLEIGYRIMSQPTPLDDNAPNFIPPAQINLQSNRNKVLGIYKPWFDLADEDVKVACNKAIDHLTSKLDYEKVDITIPLVHEGQLAHAMTILSELCQGVKASDTHKLSAPNKVLLSVARKTTSVDFLQAQRLRNLIIQHLSHLYEKHPSLLILTPTTPSAGWRIESGDLSYGLTNANKQLRNMTYAWLANFSGCPSISVPIGYAPDPKGDVPIGLMAMSEWCGEDELVAFGYDCESYLGEERRRPGARWVDVLGKAKEGKE
ncbi:hypothetical protein PRZ48_004749 [Zasmidium cellare]|uniref:Amidase domain-containing protein n=1 Tax=Zasmidium cellare TaxID=395010 RepID=A0ABR0ER29_ZASCE|nr:hypothetical protein PRZ48_004749 [Zasmidium cellare]